jgi:hypothetical protein
MFAAIAEQLLGVGQRSNDPDSISEVVCARRSVISDGVGCSQHSPSRIIPHRGQVPENSVEPSLSKERGVFHEDVEGSNVANDSCHVVPHSAALSVDSSALSGTTNILARESSRNHVNTASPWSSVKGSHVIPNRERRENAVILSGDKYACGVGLPLNATDGLPSEQFAAEYAATSACE